MSSLPASIKRIGSKATEKRWRHCFPHYKSMGAFCCHGYQSFDPICTKALCSLSPTPVMLHIKFDQDWPTGFRDIQVWKCGRWRTTTTDSGPLVYYKLTLWAFGSGELKMVYLGLILYSCYIVYNCFSTNFSLLVIFMMHLIRKNNSSFEFSLKVILLQFFKNRVFWKINTDFIKSS